MKWLLIWVLALSMLDFVLMGADKRRARQNRRRVRPATGTSNTACPPSSSPSWPWASGWPGCCESFHIRR